jgi:hypothetical protein
VNVDLPTYRPTDKLDNRAVRNFTSAVAMLGHLCALYDRGVFEAGRLMSNLSFQLTVKRKSTNMPLLEQIDIPDSFRVIVDTATLGSIMPQNETMTPLAGLLFGLRTESPGNLVPAAYLLPAFLKPQPVAGFSALSIDAWLDDPVIPTTQRPLSRKELIVAVRDQDGGAHSDADANLQKSNSYVDLVNSFPISKSSSIQTPNGIAFAWEFLPPVTMPILRQISHELLSAIYSQTDIRNSLYLPSLVCLFDGTALKGAFVPEGYPNIGTVHGKNPGVVQRSDLVRPQS